MDVIVTMTEIVTCEEHKKNCVKFSQYITVISMRKPADYLKSFC